MFALGIRYLNGWAMATHPSDRDRAEWPPHPDRVFMALAAAHFEADGGEQTRAALEWLEGLDPPAIQAAEAHDRRAVVSYVPVNDLNAPRVSRTREPSVKQVAAGCALLPDQRPRQPRQFPTAILDDETAYMVWLHVALSAEHRIPLESLCRQVTCVGHSASLVQMWVETDGRAGKLLPNLVPSDSTSRYRLRVIDPGRLKQLEAFYNEAAIRDYTEKRQQLDEAEGKRKKQLREEIEQAYPVEPTRMRPTPVLWRGYDKPSTAAPPFPHARTVFSSDLLILRRVGGPPLGLESTLQITRALRDTIIGACPQPPPEWISGHTPDGSRSEQPHVACIPLPHVGREHADGHLLGVALALPSAVLGHERRRCLRDLLFDIVGEPRRIELRLGQIGVWQLELDEREGRPVALRPEIWTGQSYRQDDQDKHSGARRWATVTPIALDRHPKSKEPAAFWAAAEQTLRLACERVLEKTPESPRVEEVILTPVSMLEGVPHARRFPNLQRKSGGNLHHTHAIFVFDRPVAGPLFIGAGRYRGYGLCRPLRYLEGA